jgi:polar amino acid transport system substrate-binding protein
MELGMMDQFKLSEIERIELAPEGRLLIAVAVGPAASAVWCVRERTTGRPSGVTVGIADVLSERWGLPYSLIEFESSGEIVKNSQSARWTLSFTPIDDERRKVLAVGPNYYLGVSTYLAKETEFTTVSDVDQPGVRVVGVAGTATIRSAEKTLRHTSIKPIDTLDDAVSLFRNGEVDAVALGKESILSLAQTIPGTHAVAGHFHEAGTAVVAPPAHRGAINAASRAIEVLKADGTIRRIFDANGMGHADVVP